MNSITDLTGCLYLRPGFPVPHNLRNTRQDWASRLGQGQDSQHLPTTMASLFNLCGQAHRICSHLAVEAARGLESALQVSGAIQLETAREHVRRMGLDWPRAAARSEDHSVWAAQATLSLKKCPLFKTSPVEASDWHATRLWLEASLLQMPAPEWLAAWQEDPLFWLQSWSRSAGAWLPHVLAQAQSAPAMNRALSFKKALCPHADRVTLREWALTWFEQPRFGLQPHWQGASAHTGSWTRLHARPLSELTLTPWLLLGFRLAELIRLCLPDVTAKQGASCLSWGSMPLGKRQGLAWVEMARGLLMYQVRLDINGRVEMLQVLAPTEWNFHPEGVVARALTPLPPNMDAPSLAWLMAAFDPCVPFFVQTPEKETCHA